MIQEMPWIPPLFIIDQSFLGIPDYMWLESGRFYLLFIAAFFILRWVGLADKKYETADIPIRLALFYIIGAGLCRLLLSSNHGSGYYVWVPDCLFLFLLSFLHIVHRPRKAVLGMVLSLALFALFYAYDYFNVWTHYEVWTRRGMPDRFEPPFEHRWWWDD